MILHKWNFKMRNKSSFPGFFLIKFTLIMDTYAEDNASSWLYHTKLLIFTCSGNQTSISVEGHGINNIRVAVNHVYGFSSTNIPYYNL